MFEIVHHDFENRGVASTVALRLEIVVLEKDVVLGFHILK